MITPKTYKPLLPLIVTICSICILLGILTACQADDYPVAGVTRTVAMSINVTRQGDNPLSDKQPSSRATLEETDGGNITVKWEPQDKIIVKTYDGKTIGTLTYTPPTTVEGTVAEGDLSSADNTNPDNNTSANTATFTGYVTTDAKDQTTCHFFYLSSHNQPSENSDFTLDYSEQGGTLAWLAAHDVHSATTTVNFGETTATSKPIVLERPIAFGHFTLTFPEEVVYKGDPIKISAKNLRTTLSLSITNNEIESTVGNKDGDEESEGTITIISADTNTEITTSEVDIYVAIVPEEGVAIQPTFSVTIGDAEYTGSLGERSWTANTFISKGQGNGVTVPMALVTEEEDPDNPLTKFAKSNLIRLSPRGSNEIVNGFAKDETHPGALFQWGRNYGFMPVDANTFTEDNIPDNFKKYYSECVENEDLYSHWLDAFGKVTEVDGKITPEYVVLLPLSSTPVPLSGGEFDKKSLNTRTNIKSEYVEYDVEKYNHMFLMESALFEEANTFVTRSGLTDYWYFPYQNPKLDGHWNKWASNMNFNNSRNDTTLANPCPAGWRLPIPDDFKSILPSAIWETADGKGLHGDTFDELMTKAGIEIKTAKNGKKYAFRWLRVDKGLKIQSVEVSDDYSESDLTIWTSKKVVTRIFPFTGRIEDLTISNYPTISLPFYLHDPISSKNDIISEVSYGESNNVVSYVEYVDLEKVDNKNQFFGGYWIDTNTSVFTFYTEEVVMTGFDKAVIEVGADKRPYGYAIRPVKDENSPSNAKRK